MVIEVEALKSLHYFTGLDSAELEFIKGFMVEKTVAKGELLLSEGETSNYLFLWFRGW